MILAVRMILFSDADADAVPCSLQYQNRKAEYFKAIWDVINWKTAEKRFDAAK